LAAKGVFLKPDVVFIHGLMGSLDFFDPTARLKDFNILCPSMHGYGDNVESAAVDQLDLDDQVDFVISYLESRSIKKVWLVGHSVGGAIAMLLASRHPQMVLGLVNVEGNFTLDDAFWSQRIAKSDSSSWAKEYESICGDPEKWLTDSGISTTAIRIQWAGQILGYQNARTVQNVARTVVDRTGRKNYLEMVRRVLESGIPVFLYAGENSRKGWNVPDFLREKAEEFIIQEGAGHMMMLEDPDEFCKTIKRIICRNVGA